MQSMRVLPNSSCRVIGMSFIKRRRTREKQLLQVVADPHLAFRVQIMKPRSVLGDLTVDHVKLHGSRDSVPSLLQDNIAGSHSEFYSPVQELLTLFISTISITNKELGSPGSHVQNSQIVPDLFVELKWLGPDVVR